VSNGWSNGHQNPQVTVGSDTVGFADIGNEHITRLRGKCRPVFRQKLSGSFKNGDAQLPLNFMGMDGKLLTRPEIEVQDFEIRRIMNQEFFSWPSYRNHFL